MSEAAPPTPTPPTAPPPPTTEPAGSAPPVREPAVPVSVVADLREQLRGTREALSASESRIAAIEAQAARDREARQLAQIGYVDDDAIDLVYHYHSRLPAEGRPSVVDYARGLTPETAPVGLRALLPGSVQTSAPATTTGEAPAAPAPAPRHAPPQPAPGTGSTTAPGPAGDPATHGAALAQRAAELRRQGLTATPEYQETVAALRSNIGRMGSRR